MLSRVARFKRYYAIAIGAAIAAALLIMVATRQNPWMWILFAGVALIPGRVQGLFYRDLYTGRRLLDSDRPAEALVCFERFLASLRAAPWRKHLLWLQFSVYTTDAEAMTLNNIGAAQISLRRLDEAQRTLEAAIAIDPQYPLPFFNLAVLHSARNEPEFAERAAAEAARLGFTGSTMDTVVRRAASVLATVEGKATP